MKPADCRLCLNGCTIAGPGWGWAQGMYSGSLPSRGELPPSHPILSVDLAQSQWHNVCVGFIFFFNVMAVLALSCGGRSFSSGLTQTCMVSSFHPKTQPKKREWPLLLPLQALSDWVWKHACPCPGVLAQGSSSHCSYIPSPGCLCPHCIVRRGPQRWCGQLQHSRVGREPAMQGGHGIPGHVPTLSDHSSQVYLPPPPVGGLLSLIGQGYFQFCSAF